MIKLVIFASGSGTNAENIIKYFKDSTIAKVSLVLSNNKNAKVFERCKRLKVDCNYFTREDFYLEDKILRILKEKANFIVLAGFLLKVPEKIIDAFSNKIINIHPALLPKYGGKGMYGMNVHNAVFENKEAETGITIHFVNKNYDEGAIIFQAKTAIDKKDKPEDIANKIHKLEHAYFPKVIENIIIKDGK